jgi:hypothetical protein
MHRIEVPGFPQPLQWLRHGKTPFESNHDLFDYSQNRPISSSCSSRTRITSTLTSLCFQLFLQLFQKPPVGALGENFLRASFDHAGFVQTESVEAYGILRIELAPLAIGTSSIV